MDSRVGIGEEGGRKKVLHSFSGMTNESRLNCNFTSFIMHYL